MGSKERRAYTAMEMPVNVASRLEGAPSTDGVGYSLEANTDARERRGFQGDRQDQGQGKDEPSRSIEPVGT